jgi:DNA-binding SARP family transcriptional activator/sugar lactone lactonase YvrE
MQGVEFRILGPLEVGIDGVELRLAGGKQRALLSLLLLHANHVISTQRLLQDLWGDDPPDTAANMLQVYIAGLRRRLEPNRSAGAPPSRVLTRDPGYLLVVGDGELDLDHHRALVEEGRELAPTDPAAASRLLRRALGLWRGPALENVNSAPFVVTRAAQLDDLRLGATESAIAIDLALGRHTEVLPELHALVAAHPYREGLRAQLMLALYRCGRQADALQVYRDTRHLLSSELGIDPGTELQALERAILRQDSDLAASAPTASAPAAPAIDSADLPTTAIEPSSTLSGSWRRTAVVVAVASAIVAIAGVSAALGVNFVVPALQPAGPVISSVAGNGVRGFSLDGIPALRATLSLPPAVAIDRNRTVYFVDGDRIRRIGSDQILATVAGTGVAGYSGDGRSAQLAQLNFSGGFYFSPVGMAFDSLGNLYIGDALNHRVRRVTPEGTISTVAGSGTAGFSGDGGPAIAAQLNTPRAVAVDRFGNLYICDTKNNRVRKVDSNGTIATIAGTGVAGYSGDDGPAEAAQFDNPQAVVVGADGNLLVADTNNQRIREIAALGRITSVAGNGQLGFSGDGGPATSARLSLPDGVAVAPNGLIYIADTQNNRVRIVDLRGTIRTFAGSGTAGFSGDGAAPGTAQLDHPLSVAVDDSGAVFVADSGNNRIRRIAPAAR